jgi:hypothetical protein
VSPRAVLDAVVKRKIPSTRRESNPDLPARSPAPYRLSYHGSGEIAVSSEFGRKWEDDCKVRMYTQHVTEGTPLGGRGTGLHKYEAEV